MRFELNINKRCKAVLHNKRIAVRTFYFVVIRIVYIFPHHLVQGVRHN